MYSLHFFSNTFIFLRAIVLITVLFFFFLTLWALVMVLFYFSCVGEIIFSTVKKGRWLIRQHFLALDYSLSYFHKMIKRNIILLLLEIGFFQHSHLHWRNFLSPSFFLFLPYCPCPA